MAEWLYEEGIGEARAALVQNGRILEAQIERESKQARANALAAQGRDIINLGIGQPDFRTPDFIVEAAIKALRDGHHGYTPANGIPPLREAVAADLGKRFNVEVSPESVTLPVSSRLTAPIMA